MQPRDEKLAILRELAGEIADTLGTRFQNKAKHVIIRIDLDDSHAALPLQVTDYQVSLPARLDNPSIELTVYETSGSPATKAVGDSHAVSSGAAQSLPSGR